MTDTAKKVHIIWAHHRKDSLTAKTVEAVKKAALDRGFEVSDWEAYSSGFDPVARAEDEPDWSDLNKKYSEEATALADDLRDKDYLVFVFPVWWYSLPAILKGYIDRVWNHGVFYGERGVHKLPVKAVRWIALFGGDKEHAEKRDYDKYMEHYLNIGLAEFCGSTDSKVEILYETIAFDIADKDKDKHYNALIDQAVQVIKDLD